MSTHQPCPRPLAALCALALSAGLAACGEGHAEAAPPRAALSFLPVAVLSDGTLPVLARPRWITTDAAGRFVLPDVSDRDVKIYGPRGERVATVGRAGAGPGEFRSLTSAEMLGDSLLAYDFSGSRLNVFAPDGRWVRSFPLPKEGLPRIAQVRVVDDSLLLLVGTPIRNPGANLLALMRRDHTLASRFFNRERYFDGNPALIQQSQVVADARAGCVFAGLSKGDSVFAFDYAGRPLAAGPVDPDQPLVSLRTRISRNRGRAQKADGGWVNDGDRVLLRVVAMDGCRAALHVAPYDAQTGADALEGGTVLVVGVGRGGRLNTLAREDVDAGLTGRARDGTPLLLRYGGPDATEYQVLRLDGGPAAPAGETR